MRTYLNKSAGSRVLMVGAVAALILSASACGGKKSAAETIPTSTTATATAAWAGSVCTALTDWKTSLLDAKSTLQAGGFSEDNVKSAGNEAREATQTLATTLKDLGAPTTAGGDKAKQELENFATSLEFSVNQIKDALSSSPSSAEELKTAGSDIRQAEATMVAALGSAVVSLKQFKADGEIEQSFNNAPSCAVYF